MTDERICITAENQIQLVLKRTFSGRIIKLRRWEGTGFYIEKMARKWKGKTFVLCVTRPRLKLKAGELEGFIDVSFRLVFCKQSVYTVYFPDTPMELVEFQSPSTWHWVRKISLGYPKIKDVDEEGDEVEDKEEAWADVSGKIRSEFRRVLDSQNSVEQVCISSGPGLGKSYNIAEVLQLWLRDQSEELGKKKGGKIQRILYLFPTKKLVSEKFVDFDDPVDVLHLSGFSSENCKYADSKAPPPGEEEKIRLKCALCCRSGGKYDGCYQDMKAKSRDFRLVLCTTDLGARNKDMISRADVVIIDEPRNLDPFFERIEFHRGVLEEMYEGYMRWKLQKEAVLSFVMLFLSGLLSAYPPSQYGFDQGSYAKEKPSIAREQGLGEEAEKILPWISKLRRDAARKSKLRRVAARISKSRRVAARKSRLRRVAAPKADKSDWPKVDPRFKNIQILAEAVLNRQLMDHWENGESWFVVDRPRESFKKLQKGHLVLLDATPIEGVLKAYFPNMRFVDSLKFERLKRLQTADGGPRYFRCFKPTISNTAKNDLNALKGIVKSQKAKGLVLTSIPMWQAFIRLAYTKDIDFIQLLERKYSGKELLRILVAYYTGRYRKEVEDLEISIWLGRIFDKKYGSMGGWWGAHDRGTNDYSDFPWVATIGNGSGMHWHQAEIQLQRIVALRGASVVSANELLRQQISADVTQGAGRIRAIKSAHTRVHYHLGSLELWKRKPHQWICTQELHQGLGTAPRKKRYDWKEQIEGDIESIEEAIELLPEIGIRLPGEPYIRKQGATFGRARRIAQMLKGTDFPYSARKGFLDKLD